MKSADLRAFVAKNIGNLFAHDQRCSEGIFHKMSIVCSAPTEAGYVLTPLATADPMAAAVGALAHKQIYFTRNTQIVTVSEVEDYVAAIFGLKSSDMLSDGKVRKSILILTEFINFAIMCTEQKTGKLHFNGLHDYIHFTGQELPYAQFLVLHFKEIMTVFTLHWENAV